MQRENPAMPTRVLKSGTKIRMHFGDTVIPGILNDSETAKALITRLPVTVEKIPELQKVVVMKQTMY